MSRPCWQDDNPSKRASPPGVFLPSKHLNSNQARLDADTTKKSLAFRQGDDDATEFAIAEWSERLEALLCGQQLLRQGWNGAKECIASGEG